MFPSPNQTCVYLLGAFRVELKTQSIRLPTRKIEGLLAYLILHPGAHTREKLASLFWGDSSDAAARGSLRKALTLLRKHITSKIVRADRENVQLNPSFPLWVDVNAFEKQVQELLASSSPHPAQFNSLGYQGDLLSDFYDDWILPLREHYRGLYLDVMLRAVEQSRAQSEYKLAIKYAQNILAIDIANERAHQHLMFCYITLGDRNKALGQYETCQRALRNELAVEPARETRALYEWIKQTASDVPSMAARITNLPIPISSFVGRNRELSKIKQLLSSARLVTLTGAGGSGKTRLAIHAATDLIDSFKDGVWWVELAPLTEPSLIPSTVAKALGIDGRSDQPLTETLKQYLRNKRVLLVLDNCEHLIDACAHMAESLLTSCANLKILATSREALSLAGENVWPVPPLSLPEVQITLLDLLMEYEGVCLFVERASAVNPDFTPDDDNAITITQICQQLDGIPLAIELAAARIRTMSVEQISAGLDNTFQLLAGTNRTANPRHQTLRAAIDWSYELLSEAERQLFCRLSVFAGSWALDATETVCSGDGIDKNDIPDLLARLVDKSLVALHTEGQRYSMLETMRQYGNEKLIEDGKLAWLVERHLDYYLNMARIGDEKIRGSEQLAWIKWFDFERDNLARAMEIALDSSETLEKGCELTCALCWYWSVVGDFAIMKRWLEVALSRCTEMGETSTRAKVLFCAGSFSTWGLRWLNHQQVRAVVEESLAIRQELLPNFSLERAQCLLTLGYVLKTYFDNDIGFEYLNESIDVFKKTGSAWWHAWALNLSVIMLEKDSNDIQTIRNVLEEETLLWEKTGDQFSSAIPLLDLGALALEQGDFFEAQRFLQRSLQRFNKFGAKGFLIQILHKLGNAARGLKRYDQAETYYKDCVPLAHEIMWESSLPEIYSSLGFVALFMGNFEQADEYFDQALKVSMEFDQKQRKIFCIAGYASLVVIRGEGIKAARLFGAFFTQLESLQIELKIDQNLLEPVDEIEINNYLALCKKQLEEAAFKQAWNMGASLSLDDVMNEILKEGN